MLCWLQLAACLCALSSIARAEAPSERNFFDTIQDTLGDFEYDIKHGT